MTSRLIDSVTRLLQMYAEGALGGDTMPEDALIGVVPASERANVLTLGMSLNYQRDAYRLWASVAVEPCGFSAAAVEVPPTDQKTGYWQFVFV